METSYADRLLGRLEGMLHWPQFDALWAAVRAAPQGWYIVEAGQALPASPVEPDTLLAQLDRIDTLLRQHHRQNYCGIVYADDAAAPSLIKVFDPRTLGSMCSCSAAPTPPAWILSRWRPEPAPAPDLRDKPRWWDRLRRSAT